MANKDAYYESLSYRVVPKEAFTHSYMDRAIGPLRKRFESIIAVKGGHAQWHHGRGREQGRGDCNPLPKF